MNKFTKITAITAIVVGTFTGMRSCNREYQLRQPRPTKPVLEDILPGAPAYYHGNGNVLTGSIVQQVYMPIDIDGNGIDALVTTGASKDAPLRVVFVNPEKQDLFEKAGYDCRETYVLTPEIAQESKSLEAQMRQFGLKLAEQKYIEDVTNWDKLHRD
jgi:hypothetical protein